ncbi:hypothetical protein M758_8G125300 [Ceratodon purpureus]|nr:hypothetical protein M758_8G125300 [Ceratodon purpureus]
MASSRRTSFAILVTALFIGTSFLVVTAQGIYRDDPIEWLNAHNNGRSAEGRGLRPLKWNASAFQYALTWSVNAPNCFGHSGSKIYGENVAWYPDTAVTPTDAVSGWVAERVNYTYSSNSCVRGQTCEDFTQVVWNTTTSVGCAWSFCSSGGVAGKFFTCNYYPPGNGDYRRPY